jgi:predicted ATPase
MHQGLATFRSTGAEIGRPHYLALLAETYGKGGRAEEGLSVLAEALAAVYNHGERFYEAELSRLKGEVLLGHPAENYTQAETCFHQALDIGRQQDAKSLELRAAMRLSRLWHQQGRRQEARPLLADIYSWFTEGFDTADLQAAKALPEDLASAWGHGESETKVDGLCHAPLSVMARKACRPLLRMSRRKPAFSSACLVPVHQAYDVSYLARKLST